MATTSVPAVLRTERGVRAVDLVDPPTAPAASAVVEVVVEADSYERVRDKLLNSFAAIEVVEVDVPVGVAAASLLGDRQKRSANGGTS